MIKIKPTLAGFPQKECVNLFIRPIIGSTTDLSCTTYWELSTESNEVLASGNCPISEQEYLLWDDTNESLENIVLTKLNLERL